MRKYIIVFGVYFFAHYSRGPPYCWSNSIFLCRELIYSQSSRESSPENCESLTAGRPCGEEVGISPFLQLHISQKSYAKRQLLIPMSSMLNTARILI